MDAQVKEERTRHSWAVAGWVALIPLIIGLVIFIGTFYGQLREFKSLGVYPFYSTGEIIVRHKKEREGARKYSPVKNVIKRYAVFASPDKKYYYEYDISVGNPKGWEFVAMSGAMKRGKVYTLALEVRKDRFGTVNVRLPKTVAEDEKVRTVNYAVSFFVLILPGFLLFKFSRRKAKDVK